MDNMAFLELSPSDKSAVHGCTLMSPNPGQNEEHHYRFQEPGNSIAKKNAVS